MQLKTRALVLKPRNVGERDKILVLLSEDLGVIEATARGAQGKGKNQYATLCQPFCYAQVELYKGKSSWLIDSAFVEDSHFALSADPFGSALAAYFCEVVRLLMPGNEAAKEFMQLLLNLFYLMEQGKRDVRLLKAIFELRSMVLSGYAPNLVACSECGRYEDELMYFSMGKASLICASCFEKAEKADFDRCLPISRAMLNAMRYIVYGDAHKIFSFSLRGPSLDALCHVTEDYLLHCTDGKFLSLSVYHQLADPFR